MNILYVFREYKPREIAQKILARIVSNIKKIFTKNKMSYFELWRDRIAYTRLNNDLRFVIDSKHDYICAYDKYAKNAPLDNQYFIQDIWGARKVRQNAPKLHYDVGSSVSGFIAHLLSMQQKIVLIDIRAMDNDFDTAFLNGTNRTKGCVMGGETKSSLESLQYVDSTHSKNANRPDSINRTKSAKPIDSSESEDPINAIESADSISNLNPANPESPISPTYAINPTIPASSAITYIQADATNLSNIATQSIESLSALRSVEHFGLGRYGDKIEPSGWEKALKAFSRVLKQGGRLYLSVPIGKEDFVCFNAHRVFRPETIIAALKEMEIVEMSYIEGFETMLCMERVNGKLITHKAALESIPRYRNVGTTGLFEFVKR